MREETFFHHMAFVTPDVEHCLEYEIKEEKKENLQNILIIIIIICIVVTHYKDQTVIIHICLQSQNESN